MPLSKIRIHLDRSEIFLVFVLFLLTSGMMFTLGVLVGHGMGARAGGAAPLSHSTETAMAGTEHGEHGEHDEGKRKPASIANEKKQPGQGLRKAFRDSKQEALVEMALRETTNDKPKSVLDAQAHMGSHADWDRKPASESIPDPEKEEFEKSRLAEEAREKDGVPKSVKSLFERKPSAIDKFTPKPGAYTVQIASYSSTDEAEAKVTNLRKSGYNEAYTESVKVRGETWYRVSVGSFVNDTWAQKEGKTLQRRGLANQYTVRQVP